MCHILWMPLLWMLPLLGLPLFWVFDVALALPLCLGLLGLSGATFLITVQSLRQRPCSGLEGMVGDVAEVVEAMRSRGRVRYHNALWYATARAPLAVGDMVRIVGYHGLCLHVEQVSQDVPTTAATQSCGHG